MSWKPRSLGIASEIWRDASRQVAAAMPRMRSFEDISHYTVEIHRLENDGDRASREAMASRTVRSPSFSSRLISTV